MDVTSWSLANYPVEDRLERWREVLRRTPVQFSMSQPKGRGMPFNASVTRRQLGDITVLDVECGPHEGHRRTNELMATEGEYLVLLLNLDGTETVEQQGRQVVLTAGDAWVWDSTQECRFQVASHVRKRSMFVPRRAWEQITARPWEPSGTQLRMDSPELQVLNGYLDLLMRTRQQLTPFAAHAAGSAALELFVGAMGDDLVPALRRKDALRHRVDRYIEDHLTHEDLSPAEVATVHGVSERTLYRLFSETGETVGGAIRNRRLERARRDLTHSEKSIAWIAHRWGFSDSSHFGRLFRIAYGQTPREFRLAALDRTTEEAQFNEVARAQ